MDPTDDSLFRIVQNELSSLGIPGFDASTLTPQSLLLDEVGLDSLKFVDLTVGLEDALGVDEFPMQEWVDSLREDTSQMTVAALLTACRGVLSAQGLSTP